MKKTINFWGRVLIAAYLLVPGQPWGMDDWFEKGLTYFNAGRYDEAIEAFSTAIELIPWDFEAFNYRGLSWVYKGKYDRAVSDYSKALEIKPRYDVALNNRAFAWIKKGQLDRAIKDYTRALEINPDLIDAYNSNAWILATSADKRYRNPERAIELARKAVELKPGISSLDTLAAAFAAAGQFENAVAAQKRVIHMLVQEDNTEKLPGYLDRLNSYRSQKPLLISYTSERPTNSQGPRKIQQSRNTALTHIPQKGPAVRSGPYPYTIQVSSYRESARSHGVVTSLRAKGDPAFSCPVHIPGKGDWHRVFIGYYPSVKEARSVASDLKKRKFQYTHVVKKPYAVQVGRYESAPQINQIQTQLRAKGYDPYTIPDQADNRKMRILMGAYGSQLEAAMLVTRLQADGFNPQVLRR